MKHNYFIVGNQPFFFLFQEGKKAFFLLLFLGVFFFSFAQTEPPHGLTERDSIRAVKKNIKEVKKVMRQFRKTGQMQVPVIQEVYMDKAESLPSTTVAWEEEIFDFQRAKEGDEVRHIYRFTNTGKKDLYITHVKPSCGCTIPSWSVEAIKPGQSGEIEVKFNTLGKMGIQNKTITVTGNFTENIQHVLKLTGTVVPEVDYDYEEETKPQQNGQ